MKITQSKALVINAPEIFAHPDFQDWLNDGGRKFTWHKGGTPDEWSDVVVLVDPGLGGEGADSEMPEFVWDLIVDACKARFSPSRGDPHIMVRLTNLDG